MFVNEGGQGGVILLDGLLIRSEAMRSVFIFSLFILLHLRKETVALIWDLGVGRCSVQVIEK